MRVTRDHTTETELITCVRATIDIIGSWWVARGNAEREFNEANKKKGKKK
jgi:hypothetical protein